jgi:hypothetical protein
VDIKSSSVTHFLLTDVSGFEGSGEDGLAIESLIKNIKYIATAIATNTAINKKNKIIF